MGATSETLQTRLGKAAGKGDEAKSPALAQRPAASCPQSPLGPLAWLNVHTHPPTSRASGASSGRGGASCWETIQKEAPTWASQPTPDSRSPKLSFRGACLVRVFPRRDCASQSSRCGDWELCPLAGRPRALIRRSRSGNGGDLQALHSGRRALGAKSPGLAQQFLPPVGGAHTALGARGWVTVTTRPHTSGLSPPNLKRPLAVLWLGKASLGQSAQGEQTPAKSLVGENLPPLP